MKLTPPVRFVASILTLWIGLRVIFWTPADIPQHLLRAPNPLLPQLPALTLPTPPAPQTQPTTTPALPSQAGRTAFLPSEIARSWPVRRPVSPGAAPPHSSSRCSARCTHMILAAHMPAFSQAALMRFARRHSRIPGIPYAARQSESPFNVSLWVQWRSDSGIDALADGGELGGSQAGVSARYRIIQVGAVEMALAARLSHPLEHDGRAEAAIGLAVRPSRDLPVEIVAERRIAIEEGGRNAWSIGIAGGVYREPLARGLELDAYAQAGIVGARRRDLYGDAAVIVSHPVALGERTTLSLGGGAWAGAQPGVSRLDIGPEASLRLPVRDGGVRLSLGWRQRIAGSAAPGSGPVLTLGADF